MKMIRNFLKIDELEQKIGYTFNNKELIVLAFMHSSYWNENRETVQSYNLNLGCLSSKFKEVSEGSPLWLESGGTISEDSGEHKNLSEQIRSKISICNERLEFLGDSVLGLIVAEFLYARFPGISEGKLSDLRAAIVDATACAQFTRKFKLEEYILLGKGEQMNAGKGRESIIADLFEALIGAIYLDRGFLAAREFFFRNFQKEVEAIISMPSRNWKAELQEYVQKRYAEPPIYEVLREWGPPHQKNFHIAVFVNKEKKGEGMGCSKKIAQQQAACDALSKIIQGSSSNNLKIR